MFGKHYMRYTSSTSETFTKKCTPKRQRIWLNVLLRRSIKSMSLLLLSRIWAIKGEIINLSKILLCRPTSATLPTAAHLATILSSLMMIQIPFTQNTSNAKTSSWICTTTTLKMSNKYKGWRHGIAGKIMVAVMRMISLNIKPTAEREKMITESLWLWSSHKKTRNNQLLQPIRPWAN